MSSESVWMLPKCNKCEYGVKTHQQHTADKCGAPGVFLGFRGLGAMADEEGTSAAVSAPEATPVADEVAVATATADEETEARNALEHNLKTKGKNRCVHGHTASSSLPVGPFPVPRRESVAVR